MEAELKVASLFPYKCNIEIDLMNIYYIKDYGITYARKVCAPMRICIIPQFLLTFAEKP